MKPFSTFNNSGYATEDLHLLQGTRQEDIAPLLAECPVLRLAPGQLLEDASDGARLYIVLRGALHVASDTAGSARGDAASTRVLQGECIGELAVLDGGPSGRISAQIESDVLAIEGETLWKLIDDSNAVARNLLHLLSFRLRAANAQLRRRQKVGEFYRQLSMVDGLTELRNRAWLNENLPHMISEAHAGRRPLSAIMIDIDHFKRFNDAHGHVAGDRALRAAAKAISDGLRPSDVAARFGGEELIVLLPDTDCKSAAMVARRLCERLRAAVVFSDAQTSLPHITASFGVATLMHGQQADELVAAADAALYRAKEGGRDRVAL